MKTREIEGGTGPETVAGSIDHRARSPCELRMTKNFRQGQILKLIRFRSIFTQEELGRALKETGIDATQVTLSRDMRELGLVKTPDGYRELGRDHPNLQFATLAVEFLQDVRLAQNQIVLKTAPGHASSVAVALIDDEEWRGGGGHDRRRRYNPRDLLRFRHGGSAEDEADPAA